MPTWCTATNPTAITNALMSWYSAISGTITKNVKWASITPPVKCTITASATSSPRQVAIVCCWRSGRRAPRTASATTGIVSDTACSGE